MTSEIRTKDHLWRKVSGEILKGYFCYCWDLKMSWLEHSSRFNKCWVWNKNLLLENFLKLNKQGDIYQRHERRQISIDIHLVGFLRFREKSVLIRIFIVKKRSDLEWPWIYLGTIWNQTGNKSIILWNQSYHISP